MGDLLRLSIPWWELTLRSIVVYVALLAGLRIFGKREVGQFTLFDLVFVLLVANAVQPAMTGPDSSLLGGVIIILSLLVANLVVGRLDRIPAFHKLVAAEPAVIVRNGRFLEDVMNREGVDENDALMAMREHGIEDLDEVKLAVLESDGSISIVGKGSRLHRTRRRVRYSRRA